MSRRRTFFSLVFGLTGVGNALVGATLPVALQHWHLNDQRGGLLLLAAFGGSTSGAFFADGSTGSTAAAGLACSAVGLLALGTHAASGRLVFYGMHGFGLGLTMTSVSLMRAREVDPAAAHTEMNRLNLLWAFGAFCAPALAMHSLRLLSPAGVFTGMGVAFAVACLLTLLFIHPESSLPADGPAAALISDTERSWAPLRFGLFATAAVGLESAIGSWLATYASRSAPGVFSAVSANSAFWAGLLISRAFYSVLTSTRTQTRAARAGHIAAVGVALLLLIGLPTRDVLPAAGLLCGLGLGPLYPWVLSVAVPRFRSTMVFVLAGVGASIVPWLTGALSFVSGSLRIGLLVPVAAFALMLAVTLTMTAPVLRFRYRP